MLGANIRTQDCDGPRYSPGEPNPLILSRLPGGGKLLHWHKRPLFAAIAADGRDTSSKVVNKIVSTGKS